MRLFSQSLGFDNAPPELFASLLQLPNVIHGVVGDTLQLFYKGMILTPYSFHVRITCNIGDQYPRYFEVIPASAGNYSFKVELLGADYTIIASKTVTLSIGSATQQPASTHYLWTIGDSLTAGDIWPSEMNRRLTGTGGTPAGNAFGNIVRHNHGDSGKYWQWLVNDEDSPFVYSGVLDFEQYRVDNALQVPNSMYILLTWNGMGSYRNQSSWDLWDNDVYTFIDGVKSDFPNCDIKLMSPQLPSLTGSLGIDYGAKGEYYSDYFLELINAKKQAQIYSRIITEPGYLDVEHIETSVQFDNEFNMGLLQKPVNTRNPETEYFGQGNSGVHPRPEGYDQIADAAYRNFIVNYCQ